MSVSPSYPNTRPRRLRQAPWVRDLVQENTLTVKDLVGPVIIIDGDDTRQDIESMPNVQRLGLNPLIEEAARMQELGIPALALFPYTNPDKKDDQGREALNPDNLICRAVRALKEAKIDIGIMCDVALDPYTTHGHDGILDENGLCQNDATVEILRKQSLLLTEAGCDIIAPSDMMDGRIGAIRQTLETNNHTNTLIMSYAAKYASGFYGPYRDAVGSATFLAGSDKKNYQMNIANSHEALQEAALDISEGADMVMVKPGMPYLDIIAHVKQTFQTPTFAFQVSGEYAMMMAACQNGWLDEQKVLMESLLCFKRAGCDGVLSYAAVKIAEWLKG